MSEFTLRAKYDFSTKEFEVLRKDYIYDKYSRILKNEPKWVHEKYYKTLEGAYDAVTSFRDSEYDKVYRDYPAMGDIENEAIYPHIKPRIKITRYKAITRDPNKPFH